MARNRLIPSLLKEFLWKDKISEYLQLQDPNGYFVKIRVQGNTLIINRDVDNSRIIPVGYPEVIFDYRHLANNSGDFGADVGDLQYTLRRTPIPGETFLFFNGANAYSVFVINENAYVATAQADLFHLAYETVTGCQINVRQGDTRGTFKFGTTMFTTGDSLNYMVDPEHDQPWIIEKSGTCLVDESEGQGYYTIVLLIKFDYTVLDAAFNQQGLSYDDANFTVKIWHNDHPSLVLTCVLELVPALEG